MCWRKVGHAVHQSEEGVGGWTGHKDGLSASVSHIICGPRLTPAAHTHTHQLMMDKFANKGARFAGSRFSLNCSWGGGWNSHDTTDTAAGYLHCCVSTSSAAPTLSRLSAFLLCSLPVRETDVHCELERRWRLHHRNPLQISTHTKMAETMGCFQMVTS